jgi:hypothetical protein
MLHLASRPFLLVQVLIGAVLAAVLSLQRPAECAAWRRLLATVTRPINLAEEFRSHRRVEKSGVCIQAMQPRSWLPGARE